MRRWRGSLLAPGGGGTQSRASQAKEPLELERGYFRPVARAACFVRREAWVSSLANWFGGGWTDRMLFKKLLRVLKCGSTLPSVVWPIRGVFVGEAWDKVKEERGQKGVIEGSAKVLCAWHREQKDPLTRSGGGECKGRGSAGNCEACGDFSTPRSALDFRGCRLAPRQTALATD